MIVILKRDDLLNEHRHLPIEDLQLGFSGLSSELIEKAELIVFVENNKVKFLKHFPGILSKDSFEVFLRYIMSVKPTPHVPFNKKRVQRRQKPNK